MVCFAARDAHARRNDQTNKCCREFWDGHTTGDHERHSLVVMAEGEADFGGVQRGRGGEREPIDGSSCWLEKMQGTTCINPQPLFAFSR